MSDTEHEEQPEQEAPDAPEVDDDPDQAEGGEPEDFPEEPEAPAEPEQRSDEDRAKLAKAIDTRFGTYRKSVEDKLGDEVVDWMLCPLCASGMAPGFFNRHDLGRVPDEVQTNVMTVLGYAREQEYEQDPNTHTCQTCGGKTKVKSGAVAGEYITRTCPACFGYGFEPPPTKSGGSTPTNGRAEESVAHALADLDTPERDNWGEPRVLPDGTLNGNFGKMPQFKSVHPVYGVTANLTPEEIVSG